MSDDALFAGPKPIGAASLVRLIVCLALCASIGAIGGVVTSAQISGWYASLEKPVWTPPNAAFPIAWSVLYVLIAIAVWRLWDRAPPSKARTRGLTLLLIQLALNASWSPVFFGMHAIRTGLAIIVLLVAILAAALWESAKADKAAAWLLAPYLAWVSFAAGLNGAIAALNP